MTLPTVISITDDATGQPVANYAVTVSKDGKSNIFEYDMNSDDPTQPISGPGGRAAIGPHTIAFSDGTSLKVPLRQSRCRFRFPWVTSNVVTTAADLIARRIMPTYGDPGAKLRVGGSLVYDGPNAFPGMTRGMGSTGERSELQICTDHGAYFLITGNPNDVLAQGEALGTIPVHFVDKTTRKPINKLLYPYADCYGDGAHYHQGNPWFRDTPHGDDIADHAPWMIDPETNHAPDPGFLACMITRDPYHLRNQQCWANYAILLNWWLDPADNIPVIIPLELRYLAWALNIMLSAYIATKEFEDHGELPDDCLPSSYFLTLINKFADSTLASFKADPNHQWCRVFWTADASAYAPWQQNYIMSVLGRAVLNGLTKFNEYFLWGLQGTVDQASGKTAWWPAKPACYWMPLKKPDGSPLLSWDECVAQYQLPPAQGGQLGNLMSANQLAALQADKFNGGWFLSDDNDTEYAMGAHEVLSLGLYIHQLKIVDVLSAVPDLPVSYGNVHRMIVNWNQYPGNFFNARNAVVFDTAKIAAMGIDLTPSPTGVPDPVQVPNPIPVPPPVVVPPDPLPAPPPVPVTLQTILAKAKAILARLAL